MSALLEAALEYAGRGWPVFMCWPGRKEPHSTFAPRGFLSASTNPVAIRAWWARCPDANVAIATGAPGPDVVDVDVKPTGTGFPALNRLQRAGLLVGAQRLVNTPSGGLHLYYCGTSQGIGSLRGQYVDFRSTGGYVLAPPSKINGLPYALVEARDASGTVDWSRIRRLLDPPRRPVIAPRMPPDAKIPNLARWLAKRQEGENRNDALYWAACRAADAGIDPTGLTSAALKCGLTERETAATITSAIERTTRESR